MCLFGLALLVGCDPQVGNDYRGGPLAVLKGIVNNQSGVPPVYLIDAALLWQARGAAPNTIVGATPVPIVKMFPAEFTITVYLPPPATVQAQSSLPYAAAEVGAMTHDATPAEIANGSAILGQLADPQLYYFRSDVPAGLLAQQYGSLRAGYHLLHRTQTVDPATLTSAQITSCAATLQSESPSIALADAQYECQSSLLSHVSQELSLDSPLLLLVKNP
jgi:hypothetical protein